MFYGYHVAVIEECVLQILSLLQCQTSQMPSVKNRGFELGKYINASVINRAYKTRYIRHPHLLGGCLISEVLR